MDIQITIKIILGMLLLICGIKDGITRQISLHLAAGVGVLLVGFMLFQPPPSLISIVGGVLIGVFLLCFSKISRGQIGMGDGIIFIVTGLGLGFWVNLCLLVYSLSAASLFSIVWVAIRRKGKKQLFPFIPFVCIGYLGVILL